MGEGEKIIECVPNFSEGRNADIINGIQSSILAAGEGRLRILHTDIGHDANRTVITFAGEPDAVYKSCLNMAGAALSLIDMRTHTGVHPRIGSLDVLPLVPVSGISLEECAMMARNLASDIYAQLGVPCFLYEAASPSGRRLEQCRKGEYEGLRKRLGTPDGPDYGPLTWTPEAGRAGAFVIGARKFLGAVNFNLPPEIPLGIAREIAATVRTSGRPGKPGTLPCCKSIGWHIEEYGFCQVSCNLTDMEVTSLKDAYDEICRVARALGTEVTGIEVIGLLPRFAVKGMEDFVPGEKILENLLPTD